MESRRDLTGTAQHTCTLTQPRHCSVQASTLTVCFRTEKKLVPSNACFDKNATIMRQVSEHAPRDGKDFEIGAVQTNIFVHKKMCMLLQTWPLNLGRCGAVASTRWFITVSMLGRDRVADDKAVA